MKYTLQIFNKQPFYNINNTLFKIINNPNAKFKYFFGVHMIVFESDLKINEIKSILLEDIEYDFLLLNTSSESDNIHFNLPNLLSTISYEQNNNHELLDGEALLQKVKMYGNCSLTPKEHEILQNYLK